MSIGDVVDDIIKFEDGNMTDDEVVDFIQNLIDTGLAWQLQGSYGRLADHLISEGLCHRCATA